MARTFFEKRRNRPICDRPSALPGGESGAEGGGADGPKKAAAGQPCGTSLDECMRTMQPLPNGVDVGRKRAVYDDTDVCALMGLRRRILVQARTRRARGTDWDAVGAHVGMTAAWVARMRPDADLTRLDPIMAGDGIVTVEVAAHCQNVQVAICRRVADGAKELVRVRDSRHLHIGDQFDAEWIGTMLQRSERLNPERY